MYLMLLFAFVRMKTRPLSDCFFLVVETLLLTQSSPLFTKRMFSCCFMMMFDLSVRTVSFLLIGTWAIVQSFQLIVIVIIALCVAPSKFGGWLNALNGSDGALSTTAGCSELYQ